MGTMTKERYQGPRGSLEITPEYCKGCGICVEFCPVNVLDLSKGRVVVLNPEACTGCGLCELRCPDFAIQAERVSPKGAKSGARAPGGAPTTPTTPTISTGKPWPQPPPGPAAGPWGNHLFLQGNEACAEGAIYAGCRFFAGYPITPSTEISEHLSARLPEVGGAFIQMEDEIASLAAIIGGSLAGRKSMTATSGPGFSLMQENLGYASHCQIPLVVVNVMRGGPSTGLPTSPSQSDIQQARWGPHGDHTIIALTPGSVREMFTETVRAFNLAEMFRIPVLILVDEMVAHMRQAIHIPSLGEMATVDRVKPTTAPAEYKPQAKPEPGQLVAPLASFGDGYRFHVTGLSFNEQGFPVGAGDVVHMDGVRKAQKLSHNLDLIESNEELMLEDATTILFAYGGTALSAKAAMDAARKEGLKVGLFRPRTFWPFPYRRIGELAARAEKIIVPEMNLGQAILEVERGVAGQCPVIPVQYAGGKSIRPSTILDAIREEVS